MSNLHRRTGPPRAARRAFTLMELVIVLAILGVIAAIVVPNLLGRQHEANIKAARATIKGVEQALEFYAADHDAEFPQGNQGLEILLIAPGSDPKWKGPYIKDDQLPSDPWGNPIQYQYPPSNNRVDKPDIWSMGPDRQSGTEDDINNWNTSV